MESSIAEFLMGQSACELLPTIALTRDQLSSTHKLNTARTHKTKPRHTNPALAMAPTSIRRLPSQRAKFISALNRSRAHLR